MRKYLLLIILFTAGIAKAQTLRLAVYQYADNPRIKNLQPLADHLQQRLDIATSVESYPTVHALIKAMQENKVDLVFISTFGYLLLQASENTHPMLPLAALIAPDAKDNYKTAFVCRKQSSLTSFKDLKTHGADKRMAFVAEGSTSGNLIPRLLLSGIGIEDADKHFVDVKYAGTHANAISLLLSGSADVAAMGSTEWDKLETAEKSSLSLLLLSSEIPLGPVLINKAINASLKAQIRQELLKLHETNIAALDAIKAAWSEAKQATNFISIGKDYYAPYLRQFGNEKEVKEIIRKFIQ